MLQPEGWSIEGLIKSIIFLVFFFTPSILFASTQITFQGQIDFSRKSVNVFLRQNQDSHLTIQAFQASKTDYKFSVSANKMQTSSFNFSGDIEGAVAFVADSPGGAIWRGEIRGDNALVNQKPLERILGQFEFKNKRLYLHSLSLGNIITKGFVDMFAPYKVDLDLNLVAVDLDQFLNFWVRKKSYLSEGSVAGEIKVSVTLDRPYLKGSLESFNGFIKKLYYDTIYLNCEGYYPHMQIANSTISERNGMSYTLEGNFDLSDHENYKNQIKALDVSPLVSNEPGASEWTIKRIQDEESGITELKYLLRDRLSPGSSVQEDADMIGFERKMEF
jgi:hypothetical protein